MRAFLIWTALAALVVLPVAAAAMSPLLAWRQPIYIVAGFAGIVSLTLLTVQPLAIGGHLPGLSPSRRRLVHRWVGGSIVVAILVHVGGLWITSPPDVIDALLFRSPTPFSAWGVISMLALFGTAVWAGFLRRYVRPRSWRLGHVCLAIIIVVGTAIHAMLIEGAMETVSKSVLCAVAIAATLKVAADPFIRRSRAESR